MVRMLAISLVFSLASAACSSPTAADQSVWGSGQAGLTIDQNKVTLQIAASSGNCYSASGEIEGGTVPTGTFRRSGTYTELTGEFPGGHQYAAEYTGTVAGNQMTLSISVPALQKTVGPFSLTSGVKKTWPACQFP